MYWAFANYFADGTVLPKMGSANPTSAPYQAFRTRDGWVNLGAANQSNYERLVDVLGIPSLAADARFRTNAARLDHRAELVEILGARLLERTTAEWLDRFDAVGLPCGPVLGVPDAATHPQTLARGMVVETEHPSVGPVRGLGLPIHFSDGGAPGARVSRPAPLLGQHTNEVLLEAGFSEARIDALLGEGAVICA
jgi:formyl-CoA transferase